MKKTLPLIIFVSAVAAYAAAQAPAPSPAPAAPAPAGAASPAPAASPGASSENPSFPAQVEMVTVDVVVTDKKGEPVPGLTKDDFVITEEDTPQPITSFEAVQLPAQASEKPAPKPRVSSNVERESQSGRSFVILCGIL